MPSSSSEAGTPADLQALAGRRLPGRLGWPLHLHAELASTSDELARLAREGAPHGTTVIADAQTGGRGRQGRRWSSPPGVGLYLSVLLRPELPAPRAPGLVFAAALAAVETVDAANVATGRPGLRWPNDVVVLGLEPEPGRPRKLAGILVEASVKGEALERVVVGIGVNVRRREWPAELAGLATSLEEVTGRVLSRAEVAAQLLERLEHWSDALAATGSAPIMASWRRWAVGLGREVVVRRGGGDVVRGVAESVDDEGTLRVRTAAGRLEAIVSGDVELVPTIPA